MLNTAYQALYTVSLVVLSVLLICSFIRALKGPSIADRIVSINIIGTQVIAMICILGLMLDQGCLADVAIIYAMISFLAVVVLCKVYLGVYWQHKEMEAKQNADRN